MNLNQIYESYEMWMRKESPWRWDSKGKLVHAPILNIVNYLSKIGSRLQASMNDGQIRLDGRSSRIAVGFALMQIYLVWSQHKAHKRIDFHDFIEVMEKSGNDKLTDTTRYIKCWWLIRHILRFPKMRDRFCLIFAFWPLGGMDMGICVREAWTTIQGHDAANSGPCFLTRMPNMVQ